jgi:hypothetical protein
VLGALLLAALAPAGASADPLSFQPLIGLPTSQVAVIGASPNEAAGETWAQGQLGTVPALVGGRQMNGGQTLLRYTNAAGDWQPVALESAQGEPLNFQWWASEATQDGGVLLAGADAAGNQGLVIRDPGGAFAQAPAPSASGASAVISADEQMFPGETPSGPNAPVMAAVDESDGHTGVLLVPVAKEGAPASGSGGTRSPALEAPAVLHYDGSAWTREPICERYVSEECDPPSSPLTALALSASSPTNAWLAASAASEPLLLYRRVAAPGGGEMWVRSEPASWLLGAGSPPLSEEQSGPLTAGPLLTAVGDGVWVDETISAGSGGSAISGDATMLVSSTAGGQVAGTWCYPISLCPGGGSLGARLGGNYGSFAWPGAGAGAAGTRIITGLTGGAMLALREGSGSYEYVVGGDAGGGGGAVGPGGETLGQLPAGSSGPRSGGAAFSSPEEGWLGVGGSPELIHVTSSPTPDGLTSWPVPFRRPLLAIAGEPGATPGDASARALAVGADGEVARYVPAEGWTPEYLYNSAGERQTPNLRGVAWPEPGRAYAVGDEGAMWLWQADTGLWSPDPGEPPGFDGQLTAIAFSPADPSDGYAVGKQGVLLSYNKSWIQEAPPTALAQANFTSVAFAGGEALATYRVLGAGATPGEIGTGESGGMIVDEGGGWRVESAVEKLLEALPPDDRVLSKVAGLPDGGAVAAGPFVVIERNPGSESWHFSSEPLPEAQNVSALAAFEEGASVRALVSVDTAGEDNPADSLLYQEIDNPPGPALGKYGVLIGPDPLPARGYLLRETETGWRDEEHEDYPEPGGSDLPGWPDAVLALLAEPSGQGGWAVGGQTGGELTLYGGGDQEAAQTAGVTRYGDGPAPPQSSNAPISTPAGEATFAVGGNAQCDSPCAGLANEDAGPDAWLSGAISRASQIAGVRGFLYTGARIDDSPDVRSLEPAAFQRELDRYAAVLGAGGDALPIHAAISPSDIPTGGTSASFAEAMGALAPAGSVPSGTPPPPAGSAAYAFDSTGGGGTVRVIVLDYSQPALSGGDTEQAPCPSEWNAPSNQLQWLCAQLHYAKQEGVAAIVMGNADITDSNAPNYAGDAPAVEQVLLSQSASAYLFDSPEANVSETIGSGCDALPAYGTGTLGYVFPSLGSQDFLGASGFLLVSVNTAARNSCTGAAPASVQMIPSVGQLGLNALDGTLVHRSQVALFEGLARRPLGGVERVENYGNITSEPPEPYTPIPEGCIGSNCTQFIAPSYTFTSSNPQVGNFVERNPSSLEPRAVLQVNGKPVPDPASGLFCAFNAGTTTVTVTAGGFSYSEPVTVEAGSVSQPCGTVPVAGTPPSEEAQAAPTVAPPPPLPAGSPPPAVEPFLALAPPPAPAVTHVPPAPAPYAPVLPVATPTPPRAALPPPVPQPARPTPPSGSSEVTEIVGATEREREERGALDAAHNAAVAYEPGGTSVPAWPALALIVIAAAAGTGLRRRRPRQRPAYAQARRVSDTRRRPR